MRPAEQTRRETGLPLNYTFTSVRFPPAAAEA